jgi:hypothetical protein
MEEEESDDTEIRIRIVCYSTSMMEPIKCTMDVLQPGRLD